jgi:hypothetical protein
MTTLSLLRSTIADDLARPDLTAQIAAAISQAISFYQEERLFWMESRSNSFDTVAAQSAYTGSDDTDIDLWLKVDELFLEDSDGIRYGPLERIRPGEMERLLDTSASSGRPDAWAWYNGTFYLHPIPDAVYTVRPYGQVLVAEPSSDSEPNNPWMVRGYELIRSAAKGYIFLHTVKDPDQAAIMAIAAERELARLRRDTSKRTATGQIVATQF